MAEIPPIGGALQAHWGERWRSALWPLFRLVFPAIRVRSLEIVDVGLTQDSMESVRRLFEEALSYIEVSGSNTNLTFSSNLRRVAIVRSGFDGISITEKKYGTSLEGHEGRYPFVLASRLVWVARYIELASSGSGSDSERNWRDSCFDFVSDFIGRFPEHEEWIKYWERLRLADLAG